MVVEWGLPVGGALVVLLPAWWIHTMRHAGRHDDARARRVALLGLFALAVQGMADFSLEFLGVAAPACALAGALSASRSRTLCTRRIRGLAIALAGSAVAVTPLLPATWAWLQPPASSSDAAIAVRPLHAPLHRARAREALTAGDLRGAEARARAAVRLQPGNVDGWLLLAAVAQARGDREAERRAVTEALGRLHRIASAELVEHLVARFPAPAELAVLAPAADEPWEHLVAGLLAQAPAHADAVAAARARGAPDDPRPLRYRFEAALALDRSALALHHARLWRGLDPRDPHAHLAVARALQAHAEPRTDALREALELALQAVDPSDAALLGLVEEQLLRALLRPGAPVARERLHALARSLRARPADDSTRRRRFALMESLSNDDPP
jgi:tetratricopeptide (TPR) repeat protein